MVLARNNWPFTVQTKSPLVLRDLDILAQANAAEVGFTITTADERMRKIFEPGAPAIAKRIEALERLHAAGVRTFAMIAPLLPGGVLGPLVPVVHTQPEPDIGQAAVSPDGRLLAYVTNEPGRNSVFLTRFPSGDGKWEVGTDGGRGARWVARTGDLFFVSGNGPGSRWLCVAAVNPAQDPPLRHGHQAVRARRRRCRQRR